jgi:hypothetical protein
MALLVDTPLDQLLDPVAKETEYHDHVEAIDIVLILQAKARKLLAGRVT